MQRTTGCARIAVEKRGGQTRLTDLFQEGSAKVRFPASRSAALEAVLINTAGGMTGGDQLQWQAGAAGGAALTVTTQASEKVYRAGSGSAETRVKLSAGPHARLCWLPQETILFDGSALTREIDVDLAADAQLILVESLVFGRGAMGETVHDCRFRDRWRIRVVGELVHAEEFRLAGDPSCILSSAATAASCAAMASVVVIGPGSEAALGDVREHFSRAPDLAAGASHVTVGRTGKLLARMVAENGYALRKVLAPLIATLHGGEGLPKIWAT